MDINAIAERVDAVLHDVAWCTLSRRGRTSSRLVVCFHDKSKTLKSNLDKCVDGMDAPLGRALNQSIFYSYE